MGVTRAKYLLQYNTKKATSELTRVENIFLNFTILNCRPFVFIKSLTCIQSMSHMLPHLSNA